MGLRQFLYVGGPHHQRIVKELHGAYLQHVQDDLGVLRVVLVPAVVQGLSRPGQTDGRDQLQIEPGLAEMVRQRAMVVAGRLEPDPHRQFVARQGHRQALEVLERVHDRQAAAACFARDANQHFMAMLGNVDGDQQGRRDKMGGGHSRSPQQCGSAKPLLRPETRLWPPAARSEGCARGHNLPAAPLPDVLWQGVHRPALWPSPPPGHWRARVRPPLRRSWDRAPPGPANAAPDERYGRAVQRSDRGCPAEPPLPLRRGARADDPALRPPLQRSTTAIRPAGPDTHRRAQGLAPTEAAALQEAAAQSSGIGHLWLQLQRVWMSKIKYLGQQY